MQTRDLSAQSVLAARDAGRQSGNGAMRKGLKRNSRMLEDKTNFDVQDQVQKKKRKQCVRVEHEESTQEEVVLLAHVPAVVSSTVDQQAPELLRQAPTVVFPCDKMRIKRDGHLFASDYLLHIARSMALGEKNAAELFPNPKYFLKQKDIRPRMRTVLFTWITEVHLQFQLREVVLWTAFQICDRFLSKVDINRRKLQLVGCASLWISSKYHEIYPPLASDLVHISDNAFTKDDIIAMERRICDVLGYKFSIPNAFQFLDRYTDVAMDSIEEPRLKTRVKWLARYGMERFHIQMKALQFCPSLMAAGALFAALKLTSNRWTKSCESCSGYTESQLLSKHVPTAEHTIFQLFKRAIMDFESQSHQAIILKYKKSDRGSVSTLRRKEKRVANTRRRS